MSLDVRDLKTDVAGLMSGTLVTPTVVRVQNLETQVTSLQGVTTAQVNTLITNAITPVNTEIAALNVRVGTVETENATLDSYYTQVTDNLQAQINAIPANPDTTSFITNVALANILENYVTKTLQTTTLSNYVTTAAQTTTLAAYKTNSQFLTDMTNFKTVASFNVEIADYASKTLLT